MIVFSNLNCGPNERISLHCFNLSVVMFSRTRVMVLGAYFVEFAPPPSVDFSSQILHSWSLLDWDLSPPSSKAVVSAWVLPLLHKNWEVLPGKKLEELTCVLALLLSGMIATRFCLV